MTLLVVPDLEIVCLLIMLFEIVYMLVRYFKIVKCGYAISKLWAQIVDIGTQILNSIIVQRVF